MELRGAKRRSNLLLLQRAIVVIASEAKQPTGAIACHCERSEATHWSHRLSLRAIIKENFNNIIEEMGETDVRKALR